MAENVESILQGIFNADTGFSGTDMEMVETTPTYADLREFAAVLAAESSEEQVQHFITRHPQFITGLYGWGDESIIAFVTKPQIGTRFRADYAMLQIGQGGCYIHLVELEPTTAPLFTKSGDRAKRHNGALTQTRDWMRWITPNQSTFVNDLVDSVCALPRFPKLNANGSFKRADAQQIRKAWKGFGGFGHAKISCTIVIGRWSKLTEGERENLIAQNYHDDRLARVITYEQLARSAFIRPFRIF